MTLEEKVDQLAPGRSRAALEKDDSPEAKQLREKMRDLFKNDSTVSPATPRLCAMGCRSTRGKRRAWGFQ